MERNQYVHKEKLSDDNWSTKTIYPKHRNIKQIKRENIWGFYCVLTLSADFINLILMIVFINVWFYFIAPLVIFVVLTVVLFIYKPTSENKFKKGLNGVGDSIPYQNNQFTTEKYPNLQTNKTNKQY